MVEALRWDDRKKVLVLIDQRKLPLQKVYFNVSNVEEGYNAIHLMVVRGAPLIGFAALWTMVAQCHFMQLEKLDDFISAAEYLSQARPTAINLKYELQRAISLAQQYYAEHRSLFDFGSTLKNFVEQQMEQLDRDNLSMAKHALLHLQQIKNKKKYRLMTICNTGALACGPRGTALGVISYMFDQGQVEHVYASETRPYLQGSRLTSFELVEHRVPHQIMVEGAASYILGYMGVDAIYVGADRIVKNGDTANKVGTSSLAIIAKYYNIPFYVVAPTSSFDLSIETGQEIPIELRSEDEVLSCQGRRIAPDGAQAINPSFDITDYRLITGIICEKGVINPQYDSIKEFLQG